MLYTRPYIVQNAVTYAKRWALDRNPLFTNYTGIGGDCTNFVSQAVLAGSCKMNFTQDFGWYYLSDSFRAPAWTGVEYFYDFITQNEEFASNNRGVGPFGTEITMDTARAGDIVQLANELGDFYHTLFVSGTDERGLLVCAHSDDALDRPLASYTYSSSRALRILGVRVEDNVNCFESLYNGTFLPIV